LAALFTWLKQALHPKAEMLLRRGEELFDSSPLNFCKVLVSIAASAMDEQGRR